MDEWIYPYPYPGIDVPDTQPPLLHEDGPVLETRRARAQEGEAARVAEVAPTQAVDIVGNHTEADVPLPFAAPPGAALTF